MKTLSTMILAGGLAASVLLFGVPTASAQSRTIQGDSLTVSATVVAIDVQTRTVTTKNDKGVYETLHAPDDMKRFSELKVGDKITAKLLRERGDPDEEAERTRGGRRLCRGHSGYRSKAGRDRREPAHHHGGRDRPRSQGPGTSPSRDRTATCTAATCIDKKSYDR